MLEIVIATRNPRKLRELAAMLRVPGIRWIPLSRFAHVGDIRETGRTFQANATLKARAVARATGRMALADDSGLEVDALNGRPGVRSARFAGRHGNDQANNDKLERLMRRVPAARRGAQYRCVLALAGPSRFIAASEGVWKGRIAPEPKGRGGFGYDPLFWLPALKKTAAELSASEKNRLSHRARAAARMLKKCQTLLGRKVSDTSTERLRGAGRARTARPG